MNFNLKNNIILLNIIIFFVIAGVGVGAKMYFDRNTVTDTNTSGDISMTDPTTLTPLPTEAPTPKATTTVTTTPVPTVKPTAKPTPVTTPKPTPDNRCIISINGVKYDVTSYRKQHPGGDIFKCGSDMTKAFYGQHNNSTLKKMDKYKI